MAPAQNAPAIQCVSSALTIHMHILTEQMQDLPGRRARSCDRRRRSGLSGHPVLERAVVIDVAVLIDDRGLEVLQISESGVLQRSRREADEPGVLERRTL